MRFQTSAEFFCNALTGTNFKHGELGAIYTEYRYADSDPEDELGDAGNNKTSEIDARGNETRYEYDATTSKPTAVIDRLGNRTEYEYDDYGRTSRVTAPNSATVSYSYNIYGDQTYIYRGDEQTYNMCYDGYRNLTSVEISGLTTPLVTYSYKEGTNRLKSMEYANGSKQSLTYDRFGNVIVEKWTKNDSADAEYRYFYDASNQLVKTLDIYNKKMYNINRIGENITSIEEYDFVRFSSTLGVVSPTLVGTMYYDFDGDGKQFRKKYVSADGDEQKYVFEFRDEQNVAVQLPTGVVSHSKSDHLGRKVFDELQLGKGFMNRKFSYHEGVASDMHCAEDKCVSVPETTLVKQIEFFDGRTIEYEYDNEERITKVIDSVDGTYEYTYDSVGQLLTETVNGTVVNTMTYDGYGNILTKNGKTYAYDYGVGFGWKDTLTSFDGQSITYDANGNPTLYRGQNLTWEKGRQLESFGSNTYKYNKDGIRINKNVGDTLHEYLLDGTSIIKETVYCSSNCQGYTNEYLYDLDGTVCGLKYNGTAYYFYKNLQGDVIAITNDSGTVVARYKYDAWGVPTITEDTSGCSIATINPFRYRGYYYDADAGLYYLQSRYYDPEVGRFINADEFEYNAISNDDVLVNLFVYCANSPICDEDAGGAISFGKIKDIISKLLNSVLRAACEEISNIFRINNGYWEVKNSVVAASIDFIVMAASAVVSYFAKKAIKTIVKNFLMKRTKESQKFIRFLINLLLKSGVISIIMAVFGFAFRWTKYKIDAFKSDIVQNLLDAETKLLGKVYEIYSAISSVGSFIAFCIDILDGDPNGYYRIKAV